MTEQYKESGGLRGRELFPHQPNVVHTTLATAPAPPSPLHKQSQHIPIPHFYCDTNFYPTTSAAGDFEIDWSLYPAAEEVGLQPIDTSLEAILRMLEEPYPGPMVGLSVNDRIQNNHGHGYGEHHDHRLMG